MVRGTIARLTLLLAGAFACGPSGMDENAAASRDAQGELAQGARVRFLAPSYSRRWQSGMIGMAGKCTAVMVPNSWSAPTRFDVVRVDDLQGLRLSTLFDGRPGRDGLPRIYGTAADTAGEGWRDLPLERLRARYGGCDPHG